MMEVRALSPVNGEDGTVIAFEAMVVVEQDGNEIGFIHKLDVPPGRMYAEWTKEQLDDLRVRAMHPPALKPNFIQPMMPSQQPTQ